jgi:hypothetical protein
MADFTRKLQRFAFAGLSLNAPPDAMPPGKLVRATNLRSDTEGEITIRPGTVLQTTVPGAVHSLFRLNDPTPLDQGVPVLMFYGTGGDLYASAPGNPSFLVDSGYSGDPLTAVVAEPVGTVEPYLYVADRDRLRKINTGATVYPCGIDPPVQAPTTSLAQPGLHIFDSFTEYVVPGVRVGTAGAPIPWTLLGQASAPAVANRLNTTIATIVYVAGTTGNAVLSLGPSIGAVPRGDPNTVRAGMIVRIGTGATEEDVILQETKVAIQPTTVAAAIQDTETGLWSIMPTGGLGTGVITRLYASQVFDLAKFQAFLAAHPGPIGLAGTPDTNPKMFAAYNNTQLQKALKDPTYYTTQTTETTLADLDFPAGCLVQIGTEWTIVRSVAIGHDGLQSFLCHLAAPPTVGAAIVGVVAYRVSTVQPHVATDPVTASLITNTVTAAGLDANGDFIPSSGGVQTRIVQTATGSGSPSTNQGPGGTSPPTPAALQIPDHTDVVAAAKAKVAGMGYDLTTPCGIAQICIEVASQLSSEGCGLFAHFEDFICPTTPYGPIEADAVMYASGQIVFILGNPTGRDGPAPINVPMWSVEPPDGDAAQRFISLGPIVNPLPSVGSPSTPPPPPATGGTVPPLPLALGTLNLQALQPDDRFHASLWFDQAVASIIKVQFLFDVDAVVNDFTQNYYLFEADGNSLISALQTTPGGSTQATPAQILKNQIPASAVTPPTVTQLPIGAQQWIELTWKVRDMLRVGTDDSRGLGNIAAIGILVTIDGSLGNLKPQYGAIYATGGMNPDAFPNGAPFRYRYGFRSSITGETSNPGPQTRAEALLPLRQQIVLTAPSSPVAPQADLVDWFRIGGQLTSETYLGSTVPGETFTDNFSDQEVVGGPSPVFTRFQLWPTTDQPRAGTVNVAGSFVTWVSGDLFNVQWAPGTQILIAGLAYTLAASPASTTQLQVIESAGAGTGVPFSIQAPTLQAQPFPIVFGPFQGLYFGVGDPNNPGALYWTNANDPDTASDANFLQVTASDTPLQHGFIWDAMAFVWSTEDLYRIMPTGNGEVPFFAEKTSCGRGLWSRWTWAMTPKGPAFLAKDGIYLTAGGTVAESLTGADLSPLFPHDAVPGVPVIQDVQAPDLTQPTQLRLCYIDDYLYFDYAAVSS